jgi:ACR3 family arsenite efflux pump ArsB
VERLSTLDQFLPVWIGAMAAGLPLGRVIPGPADALDTVEVGRTSPPIAPGLLLTPGGAETCPSLVDDGISAAAPDI